MAKTKGFIRTHKKTFFIVLGIIVIFLIILLNFQAQREKHLKVDAEKVKKQDLTAYVSASGEVRPKKNVNISAHIPGRIIKIDVEEGQRVSKGDFLLKLESTQYEASAERDRNLIMSYKAELIKTEAILLKDKQYYERQKKLFDEKLISREQLESAKAQFDVSKAQRESFLYQIKQAEASLRSTLDNLRKTVYTSPIDGVITSLRVEVGEIALVGTMNNPGTILMTIADLSKMEVEIEVDETDVINVQKDQKAVVRVDAFPDQPIDGKVTEIGSSAIQNLTASQESKDFKVIVTLQNPPPNLKPGLSASADIIIAEKKNVLAVPISSLVLREKEDEKSSHERDLQEEGVFLIENNRVNFTAVKKGIMGELMIEVQSGIQEGQSIAVGPYNALRQLRDGMLVKPEWKINQEK